MHGSYEWNEEDHDSVVGNFLKWYDEHFDELSDESQMVVRAVFLNEYRDDDGKYLIECYGLYPGRFSYECTYGRHYEPFDEIGTKLSECSPSVMFYETQFTDCDWCTIRHFVIQNGKCIDAYKECICTWWEDKTLYMNVGTEDELPHPTAELPTGYYYADDEGNHSITKEQFDKMMENAPDGIVPMWRW